MSLAAIAAVFDIRFRRIPNWLVLAAMLTGLVWHIYVAGLYGLAVAFLGLGLGLILYLPLYLLRARGAGDVKLLMALGAITGPVDCFWIFLFTAVLGAAFALIWIFIWGRGRQTLSNIARIMHDLIRFKAPWRDHPQLDVTSSQGMRLPHAAMIAIGVLAFLLVTRDASPTASAP